MSNTFETTSRPFAEAGKKALVTLAHPDDEYLVGGGIDAQVRGNAIVHAYIATKGRAGVRGDEANRAFIRDGKRWLEGSRALSAYGVRRENQYFHDHPDGELIDIDPQIVRDDIYGLLVAHGIKTVITLGEGFGHTDHVAVHEASRAAVVDYAEIDPDVRLYSLDLANPTTYISTNPITKFKRLSYHRSQVDIDMTDPSYLPAPGSIEQPGIRLSAETRDQLARYALLQWQEPYALETFASVHQQPTTPDFHQLARV